MRDFDKHPLGSSAANPRKGDKYSRNTQGALQTISNEDAETAANTLRDLPEMVLDEITGRAYSVFPAALKDLLMIVGDISHRAQRGGGIAIRNVREKVDSD